MPLCNMMAMQHRKNKRGLQQLSDAQKLEAITKVQKGETKAAVAREFGVPESTLRGWCKKAKLNGHCHSVMNKSLQVTSTMSPVLLTSEMAYRDCSYSKGSGSDEGSTTHPFSDEQEDDEGEREAKPPTVIPEEQRRVLDWLNYGHYPQLPAQTPQLIDTKPAQPVVTSSTCDDMKNAAKMAKLSSRGDNDKAQSVKGFGFYNWCKSNTSCGGYSSPVSPVSSDKNDSYDDEPLALIVPSKRRISDLESALKNQLSKMYQEQQHHQQQHHHQQQQNNNKQTLSVEEALQHGEVFLDWLRACSDPNVTVLQAMQIGTLIKNIRSSLERNQNRR